MSSILFFTSQSWAKMKKLFLRLEKWRWLLLAVIGLSLLWVEIQEFLTLRILNQAFHYFEVFQYAVLLISTGLLLELFARSTKAHKQAVNILENKHRISLDLTDQDDWEALIQKLTMIPSKIVDVEETYLLIIDPLKGEFEPAGHWLKGSSLAGAMAWRPALSCKECLKTTSGSRQAFHLCQEPGAANGDHIYCLEVSHQNIPTALLKFRVRKDRTLTRAEEAIFSNIRDEIIIAIQASQDRRRLSEMQSAEVAMAERRLVSTFVHDQLGQNLGYMHLKLDQLSIGENINPKALRNELNRLRDVANESYEIVRDILKKMQPQSVPNLTNLLHEHARTVSIRSGLFLDFRSVGEPLILPAETQQIVFFTFREILSNVERHASASNVDVLVSWCETCLDISVKDDGTGFDMTHVRSDEHFGLGIMQERLQQINGDLQVHASQGAGTLVSLSIPIGQVKVKEEIA
jgi:signal transduction histidine kinase